MHEFDTHNLTIMLHVVQFFVLLASLNYWKQLSGIDGGTKSANWLKKQPPQEISSCRFLLPNGVGATVAGGAVGSASHIGRHSPRAMNINSPRLKIAWAVKLATQTQSTSGSGGLVGVMGDRELDFDFDFDFLASAGDRHTSKTEITRTASKTVFGSNILSNGRWDLIVEIYCWASFYTMLKLYYCMNCCFGSIEY